MQARPVSQKEREAARVLYAEDDEAMRDLTTGMLARAGYKITAVKDGQAAWEALQTNDFDLLITDNDMPYLTGVEVVAKLRRKNCGLPIILASGSADFFSGEEYRWLGFSACLQKPFPLTHLLQTAGRLLEGTQARHTGH